ncbi:MAG TPA: LuxR C-terminal-related transcriptional regulator [Streptosporangiaceae bacterium]|nr:LuxR C-terminal-related transcriptional regulator [Streptosporangiaceae bacterium]
MHTGGGGHRGGDKGELGPVLADSATSDSSAARYGLYGRDRELRALDALICHLTSSPGETTSRTGGLDTDGMESVLLVRGEPGLGKSALLAAAGEAARAAGVRLLAAAGVPSEAAIPFAGLHHLLQPVLHRADELPGGQREVLESAFGLAGEATPEPLPVALATLTLITAGSADGLREPVLLVIDNAQWLDQPSSVVLGLVARRLGGRPAAMVVCARYWPRTPLTDAGLPGLDLAGLSEDCALAVLSSQMPDLELPARDRLVAKAAGNPLALAELPRSLPPPALSGTSQAPLPAGLQLSERLEQVLADQVGELPDPTRSVLLLAATDDRDGLGELLGAASILAREQVTAQALDPAITARLVEVRQTSLRFRNPLVGAAIYQAAGLAGRQAAHAALAEVLADQPDRQVWHKAAAAFGPDEELAGALDEAAIRAERRGAVAIAASALERAAELSSNEARRGTRLLRAAELAFDSGHPGLGPQLLKAAEPLDLPTEERTWLSWLRQSFSGAGWSGAAKVGSIIAMADRLRSEGHPERAAESLHTAAYRCWWQSPDQQTRAAVIAAAERIGLPPDHPAQLAILALTDPIEYARPVAERIARLSPDPDDPAGSYLIGTAATAIWAYDLSAGFLEAAVNGLRRQGRRGLLAQALVAQTWAAVHLADGPVVKSAAAEADRLARESGQVRWAIGAQLALASAVAEEGDGEEAEALAAEAEAKLMAVGTNSMLALAQFARGRAALARQRYQHSAEQLRRILDPADPAYHTYAGAWCLAELVEAEILADEPDAAREHLARLESLVAATSAPLLRAQLAYARPMLAPDDRAEQLCQSALADDLVAWPHLRGRMQLWYGRWLRRQRRIADSRGPLRAAQDTFSTLKFTALADCARQELRASGVTNRRNPPETRTRLTPQELEIAKLAAGGLSNREIGQRLYISHRTVGYHLHRIFPKLGITSRSQLHATVARHVSVD